MLSTHTVAVISVYIKTDCVGILTLVPHASDMTVAATTDTILAVLNLFPDIVVR